MRPYRSARSQRGQLLWGVLLGLVVFTSAVTMWLHLRQQSAADASSSAQGVALAQYAVGVRGFEAAIQAGPTSGGQALPQNPWTVTGVDWLKPPTCGGLATNPPQGYVPCAFTGGEFGSTFQTVVTLVPATNAVEIRTEFMTRPAGAPDNSAAARAATVFANQVGLAAQAEATPPSNGLFVQVLTNSPALADTQTPPNLIAPADQGRVVLIADNAPSNDLWLRTDGTNMMQADLNMGGQSIVNAKHGDFSGDVRVHDILQVDNGLVVTNGITDAEGGVRTTDAELTSIGQFASQGIYNAAVYQGVGAGGVTVPKPQCSTAQGGVGSSPAIYAFLQGTGSAPSGDSLTSARVQAVDNGSYWTVIPTATYVAYTVNSTTTGDPASGYQVQTTLTATPSSGNPTDQTIVVMTKCR